SRRAPYLNRLGLSTGWNNTLVSSLAGNAKGWRLHAPWSPAPAACWLMSQPGTWTAIRPNQCSSSCCVSIKNSARPLPLSPMIRRSRRWRIGNYSLRRASWWNPDSPAADRRTNVLIDTHCHLDAREFSADTRQVIERATAAGVQAMVIPAVERGNFEAVRQLAHQFSGGRYALGIHPIAVPYARDEDLDFLKDQVRLALNDERFVGIGEIGLDFFLPNLKEPAMRARQAAFFDAQLRIAQDFDLPVIVHVRRSQDEVLKYLRRREAVFGIAHAFNGSFQQAEQFVGRGFVLGFGGAMTFERALQIRRLAVELPLDSLVLETD